MARRRRGIGGWAIAVATVAAFALAASVRVSLPDAVSAAPRPGESCPDQTPQPGASDVVCNDVTGPDPGGRGGTDLGGLLPLLLAGLGGAAIALVAAFLIIRRRTGGPVAPADPGEWWTCRKCGRTNVIDSPRCYDCGTWQG